MTDTEQLIRELEIERSMARGVAARLAQAVGERRQSLAHRLSLHEQRIAGILKRFWHGNDVSGMAHRA